VAIVPVLLLLLAMAAPAARAGGAYTFTKVFDSAQGFDPFDFGCAALNGSGDVAVRATTTGGVTGIFLVTDVATRRIVDDRGPLGFIGRNPSLNEFRQVSFAANLDSGEEAILRGGPGGLVTIASTAGPFNFFGFDTSMNDDGRVAFKAELDSFDEGLFSGDGSTLTTHYLASVSRFGGDDSRPSINAAGHIAFAEFLDDGGQGIFVISQAGVSVVATDLGVISFADDPQLNDNGFTAFNASLDTGVTAVMLEEQAFPFPVATSSGPFSSFGTFGPSIDTQGNVAFTAELDAGGQGLFTGPDPVADRVVGTGDVLDGSAVTNVTMCAEGLNDAGQIAFTAQLADGRTAVFRADPA
jgi:hypothetical protein